MWLFTNIGFFSVVQHYDDPGLLVVRARMREDLVAFQSSIDPKPEILATPTNDYPFRCIVPREVFANWLTWQVEDLAYGNFKAEVGRVQGIEREGVYHRVWDELRALEKPGARAKPSRRLSSRQARRR